MNDYRRLFVQELKKKVKRPDISGYRPYEIQVKFHKSEHAGTIVLGGNRGGKTVAGAAETVWRLRGSHPYKAVKDPPIYGRGSAVDIEQGLNKIMLPEIARWLPPSLLLNGSWEDSYSRQSRILNLSNGSFMDFLTYEQEAEKHAGTSRDFVWFDEEPPEHIFNEDILRLADVSGQWFLTMTPVMGMTWIYHKFYRPLMEEGDEGADLLILMAPSEDNPYLPEGAVDEITRGMSDEEKQARRYGKFMAASGLIYPSFKEGINTISPIDIKGLKTPIIAALDHGLRNPTAWLWLTVDSEGRIVVFHEYYEAERTVREHANAIKLWEQTTLPYPVDYRVGDPSIAQRSAITGGSIQEEYADHNIYLGLGNNDVKYGINRTRQYIDNSGLFITDDCSFLIRELRSYRWATYSTRKSNDTRASKDNPNKINDHALDALRYGICSRPEFEFKGAAGNLFVPHLNTVKSVMPGPVAYEDYSPPDTGFHAILGDDW